jgi:Xaa-Pro aminopeptidase
LTELEQRRQVIAGRLAGLKIDALLVSSPANVRYLADYSGSNGLLLITPAESHFFTDPRYQLEASKNISCKVHVAKGPLILAASAILKRKKLKKIGFESAWVQYEAYARLKDALALGFALHPVGRVIEEQRMVKSAAEIERIRTSVRVNSEAYSRTMRNIRPGLRERDIAAELEFQMRRLGAEKAAFETIVAAGAHSALPHAQPGAHRIAQSELLLIDMGSSLEGYCSDMTRVSHAGEAPKRVRDLYRAVLEANLAGIEAVRPGVAAGKVDAAARNVLKAHKLCHRPRPGARDSRDAAHRKSRKDQAPGRNGDYHRARRLHRGAGRRAHRGYGAGHARRMRSPDPYFQGVFQLLSVPPGTP